MAKLAPVDLVLIEGYKSEPHPKLEGTIYTAAEEIGLKGPGKALPLQLDIRQEESIAAAVEKLLEPENYRRFRGATERMRNRAVFEIPHILAGILERSKR